MSIQSNLLEIASLFVRLGVIGFGGPVSTIAMMEDETVRKRKWISCDHFLEFMAIVNILPGPNSTKMAMHLGYFYAGFPGLIIAGICFLLPATIITIISAETFVNTPKPQQNPPNNARKMESFSQAK